MPMMPPTLWSAKLKHGRGNAEAKTPKIPSIRDGIYPAHHYRNSLGHGWVSADFDIIYSVNLNITPGQDGNAELDLELSSGIDGTKAILPASLTDFLIRMLDLKLLIQIGDIKDIGDVEGEQAFTDIKDVLKTSRCGWVYNYGIFDTYPQFVWQKQFEHKSFHVKSPDEPALIDLDTRLQPDRTVGLLDIPGRHELDGTKIMLAEFAQGDAAEILVGSNQYRFVSLLTEEVGAPVPCRANSIAASIFRNAAIEDADARISSLLEDRARELTRSGLEYHEAVLEFYRNAIRQNGER